MAKRTFEERFSNWWWDYTPDTMTFDVVKEYVLSERRRVVKWLLKKGYDRMSKTYSPDAIFEAIQKLLDDGKEGE